MKRSVFTRYLSEDEYAEWNRLIENSSQGSIYSKPEYLDAICEAAGGRFKILACFMGEEMAGGVALYEMKSRFGTYVSGRFLLYYNGIVLRDQNSKYPYQRVSKSIETMSALENTLSKTRYSRLLLHNRGGLIDFRPFLSRGWSVWPSYTYIVPVADLDFLWGRLEQNLKRLVKRCESKGVTLSDDDDFESFYRMHEETHRRKGSPIYLPPDAFRRFFERLKSLGLCRLYHARLPEGRPVAAQLVLLGNYPVSHTVCAAADPEYLSIGSTPFLRWKVFESLSEQGYKANDLTDAALNLVTRFKAQLGGDLQMNLVLTRPDHLIFRLAQNAKKVIRRGRSATRRLMSQFTRMH